MYEGCYAEDHYAEGRHAEDDARRALSRGPRWRGYGRDVQFKGPEDEWRESEEGVEVEEVHFKGREEGVVLSGYLV